MSGARFRCWAEVSRERIARNYRAVAAAVGPGVAVMPVVKADAYGHGAIEVARTLVAEGVEWLAVSSVDEGIALRAAGIRTRVLVMADFLPCEREALIEHNLTPAIHSLEGLEELQRLATGRPEPISYHLKLDTGMGRLGAQGSGDDVVAAVRRASHARLEGLMTHFASAAVYSSDQTELQIERFDALASRLRAEGITPRFSHMSSTIAVAYGRREAWRNMVRPGHAIYGYVSPTRGQAPARLIDVQPALEWKAAVLEIKEVTAGARIGYGGMFVAPRPMRIGVLSVGYADGLPHRLSNRGRVIVAGRLVAILGAVSMDLTTVDLTEVPECQVGDSVILLGRQGNVSIDAQQIARVAGTISYSVLCGISARVKRLYT